MTEFEKIKRVLIANRGEIAVRFIQCCKKNSLHSIAVYSTEDSDSDHVSQADESILLKGTGSSAYTDISQFISVAETVKADVVLPGYGFLSENSEFAEKITNAGIIFAGPDAKSIELFGIKHAARKIAELNSVPVLSGSPLFEDSDSALTYARTIGFPIMVKSTAGGGGMGLKVCWNEESLNAAVSEVISRGKTLYKNPGIFLEKYIQSGRHIEVQFFGNGLGEVVTFGERECSIQRRHQKVIEEAPSPFVGENEKLRESLCLCASKLASSRFYRSAGTVEFLLDDSTGEFYFLEMNTRLQVEHGVTELVWGIDLVYLMLLQAEYQARGDEGIPSKTLHAYRNNCSPKGHAIEGRLYAENPAKDFKPSPGILHLVDINRVQMPDIKSRIDTWVATGTKISPYFDPLLAKFMCWGVDREKSRNGLISSLEYSQILGPPSNKEYIISILRSEEFMKGRTLTTFLTNDFCFSPKMIEFIRGGSYTTIQDLPGRVGYNGGVPLGGAADPMHLQLANLIVGNERYVEALEMSIKGPKIKFYSSAIICLAGGEFQLKVNGIEMPLFAAIKVTAGSIVSIGKQLGTGARTYLAIKGGLPNVAKYLGSKSCTPTLSLGGHQGRVIMQGDCLDISDGPSFEECEVGFKLPADKAPPRLKNKEDIWNIHVLSGPHDTSDICSPQKLEKFYDTVYTVNINSNRGCTKLDGQADVFSRNDGGDGGSHPSNILEYPYPTCGISVIGNTMALFGPDGGTLSGYTCIAVPLTCDWWKNGQAEVGAKIRFIPVTYNEATNMNSECEDYILNVAKAIESANECPNFPMSTSKHRAFTINKLGLLYHRDQTSSLPEVNVRQAGENMILIDFGIRRFDFVSCGRQRIIEEVLEASKNEEIIRVESCTGAIAVVFDTEIAFQSKMLKKILEIEEAIPPARELKIKSTLYRLPCTFNHSALDHCIERYMHSQRPYAAYLPSNAEYVMKANNIHTFDQFKKLIIGQRQVVTAVSFFCGNTLTVNLDPRTRIQTGKYNPPRTFTPKGAIGSGSVGQSIYSIDCPGGFMIWAMTLPDLCWDTFSRLKTLQPGRPWFFSNFDQIEYYEVDEAELTRLNNSLLTGNFDISGEIVELDYSEYLDFCERVDPEVEKLNSIKSSLTHKLAEEDMQSFENWENELRDLASKKRSYATDEKNSFDDSSAIAITGGISANIFRINVKPGDVVNSDTELIVLEAMKMEIHISASSQDEESDDEENQQQARNSKLKVLSIPVSEGDVAGPGDPLIFLSLVQT